jgi:DNA-binding Lrp family transcriptional regulator
LGYPLTALIDVQTDQANPTELAQAVAKLDAVSYVAMVAGDRDLLVVVHVRDAEHLHRLVTSTLRRLPGITRTETRLLLTRSFKDLHDWSIPTDERRGEG